MLGKAKKYEVRRSNEHTKRQKKAKKYEVKHSNKHTKRRKNRKSMK